jgi:hypothetical protein
VNDRQINDRQIDELLSKAAGAPHDLKPVQLRRAAEAIESSLRPVRPLPSIPLLALGMVLVCAAVALSAAAAVGFYGFDKMTVAERVLIFSTLGVLAWLAATEFSSAMIPGSRRRISPATLLAVDLVALCGVFAFLFRDYQVEHFVSVGITCLVTGLLYAVPAGLLSWLVLRRGVGLNPLSAGFAAGTLAGLAGVGMLELHCPNFEAPHVLVWHTAVVPLSAALGTLVGWMLRWWPQSGGEHAVAGSKK